MWQRPQTLLVVLAIIGMVLAITLPVTVANTPILQDELSVFEILTYDGFGLDLIPGWAPLGFVAAALLALVAMAMCITQFKNLRRQMAINRIATLLIMLGMVALFFGLKEWNGMGGGTREIAFYLPVASLFLNVVAGMLMRKDQLKIASVDRIR